MQKYKTVVVKVPDPMSEKKPIEKPLEKLEAPILVVGNSQETELDVEKIYANSEFLKVLTDLRKVVEELKTKKKKPNRLIHLFYDLF